MKSIQFLAFAALCFLVSCQKDEMIPTEQTQNFMENAAAAPLPVKRLKERINLNNGLDYMRLDYNSNGTLSRYEEHEDDMVFTYSGNTVHIVDTDPLTNTVKWDFTGQLDAKKRLVSGSATQMQNGVKVPRTYSFSYNAAGFMTQRELNINNGQMVWTYDFTYSNGNLIGVVAKLNGAVYHSSAYEYTGSLPNKFNWNADWRFTMVPNTFTGNVNKHLPTKYTAFDANGNVSWFVDYTYTLGSDNFPVKMESVMSNGTVNAYEYTY